MGFNSGFKGLSNWKLKEEEIIFFAQRVEMESHYHILDAGGCIEQGQEDKLAFLRFLSTSLNGILTYCWGL